MNRHLLPVRPQRAPRLAPLLLAGLPLLPACGEDVPGLSAVPADAATETGVLSIVMQDFHFGELPAEIPVGTRIEVSNDSETELHEFVAVRLDDADDRPAEEIVGGDLGALLGATQPTAVLLAPPGGEQIAAVGDGTLAEPGRYLIVCAIPTGADPDEYLAAARTSDGPPQVDGGPPHFVHGMYAELVVTS